MTQLARQSTFSTANIAKIPVKIEVADIPQTQQFRRPPPPVRPSVPVPSESELIPEDLTIATSEIQLTEIPPPPAEEELPIFVAYDEPPQIVGGMAALHQHLKYPVLAGSSGIGGTVVVRVLVGLAGRAEKLDVIHAKPADLGFEESALEALKKVKWRPAKQRDKEIRVWVSIPVQFKAEAT